VVRRRWTDEADYLLLKEVVVAKAHMSPWGKMTERFQVVTNNFNANPRATFKTDHKHAKDRFQLLTKSFEALDKKRATKTGTEEVLTPMELLLVDVVEEMSGFNERNAAERKEPRRSWSRMVNKCAIWPWRQRATCLSLFCQPLVPTAVQTTRLGLCVRRLSTWCKHISPRA